MNKKILAIILVISHLLCVVLGYCIASIQLITSKPLVETTDTTETIVAETYEPTASATEEVAETVMETAAETFGEEVKTTEEPVTTPTSPYPSITVPPVTQPPVTDPPATNPPATEPPEMQPPTTSPPATEPMPSNPNQLPLG